MFTKVASDSLAQPWAPSKAIAEYDQKVVWSCHLQLNHYIHPTIKSLTYCVVHLTAGAYATMQRATGALWAQLLETREQLRFRGRGAVVWLGTPPAPYTYAQSYVQANSRKAGSAATEVKLKKLQKYFGRRLSEISHEPRLTSFLRQRLAVAVQRGIAI